MTVHTSAQGKHVVGPLSDHKDKDKDFCVYLYDHWTNTAHRQRIFFEWDAFFRSTERDLFKVSLGGDKASFITIYATNGETMSLKGVTPEQIVILFVTLRGLRRQADD